MTHRGAELVEVRKALNRVLLLAPGYDWNSDPQSLTLETGKIIKLLDTLAAQMREGKVGDACRKPDEHHEGVCPTCGSWCNWCRDYATPQATAGAELARGHCEGCQGYRPHLGNAGDSCPGGLVESDEADDDYVIRTIKMPKALVDELNSTNSRPQATADAELVEEASKLLGLHSYTGDRHHDEQAKELAAKLRTLATRLKGGGR